MTTGLFGHMSPGTYISELDLSTRVQVATSTTGAAVFASKRGTLDSYYTTSYQRHQKMYGPADPRISFAHDCMAAFHQQSSQAWNKRIVNGALHAGSTLFIDKWSIPGRAAGSKGRVFWRGFPIGTTNGYASGARAVALLAFNSALITGNVFAVTVTDGVTNAAVSVTYATSHNATMSAIATALASAFATLGTGGSAVVKDDSLINASNSLIIMYLPTDVTVSFNTPTVTSGVSQATVVLDTAPRALEVFGENPGTWANDIGVKITNNDPGIRQRWRLTLGGPLVTGNTISVKVGDTTISEAFDTDSDTTLANLAAAIEAEALIGSAEVEEVAGATNNDRSITIIAAGAGPGYVTLSAPTISGGSTQAAVIVVETLKGQNSTNEFDLEIYNRSNLIVPAERFRCTLAKQISGNGRQTAADYTINQLGTGSEEIRVIVPETARAYLFELAQNALGWTVDTGVNFLTGGDDGATVLNSQLRDGWNVFSNREQIPVRLLINCGYTDVSVQQAMIALAEKRLDAFAILDMPSDLQATQSAYFHRLNTLNIDSSYGAIYTPDLLVQDNDSDELRYIPPSGHVAAAYAYTDRNAAVWFAPAGINRGKLRQVRGLRVNYDQGDRDLLNPVGVNCIINKAIVGPVIWGEETLQYKKSSLSAVHARRLVSMIQVAYADALDYTTLFEPNNQFTRFNARQVGETLLDPIVRAQALDDAVIVCDERNNPPEVREQEILRVDVYIKVTPTSKYILLRTILTRLGADFSTLIEYVNGTDLRDAA